MRSRFAMTGMAVVISVSRERRLVKYVPLRRWAVVTLGAALPRTRFASTRMKFTVARVLAYFYLRSRTMNSFPEDATTPPTALSAPLDLLPSD
jgi:hypothetical protein